MIERFINPRLAKEVELDRPASSWPERIFRFSLYYFFLAGIFAAFLRLFLNEKQIEEQGGVVALVAGLLFGVCFIYMLNYLVWRFVKSRFLKGAWCALMSFLALLIVLAVSGLLRQ